EAGVDPCVPSAVQDRDVATVADRLEHPPEASRHPAAGVVVYDDVVPWTQTEPTECGGEIGWVGEGMTSRPGACEITFHVHEQGTWDVCLQIALTTRLRIGQVPTEVEQRYSTETLEKPWGVDQRTHDPPLRNTRLRMIEITIDTMIIDVIG